MKLSRFLFIYLFVFSFIFISKSVYADLRGPVIMELQIGMPESEAVNILKKMAHEKDLNFKSHNMADGLYYISKNNRIYVKIMINTKSKDLICAEFYPQAFNASQINANFIKNFLSSYKIPINKDHVEQNGDMLIIGNPTEGYQLVFSDGVYLQKIDKTGPIQFN